MRHLAIVTKLKRLLKQPINNECKVVYLLAEIRKLLDQDKRSTESVEAPTSPESLWMYCNWALHLDLDRPDTTRGFLHRVDLWVSHTVAHLEPYGSWTIRDFDSLLKDFIYLSTFREQLRAFLEKHELPSTLCTSDARWNRFTKEYAGVIEDGSLAIHPKFKKENLKAVKKVTFEKGSELTSDHHVPFVIQWTVELKDGRAGKLSVAALPRTSGSGIVSGFVLEQNGFIPPQGGA